MKHFKIPLRIISMLLIVTMVIQIAPVSFAAASLREYNDEKRNVSGYSTNVSQKEEEPTVLGEAIERREDSNTKYFNMSDGTIKAAIYNEPVHYLDENGSWRDIDNTLTNSSEQDSNSDELFEYDGLKTNQNSIKVKFAKNTRQKRLVSIKKNTYSMGFSLITEKKKKTLLFASNIRQEPAEESENGTILTKTKQKVFYENILPDTDLEYIVAGESIKENIVVKSSQAQYIYAFETDVKELTLRLDGEGTIQAVDSGTNKTVFVLPKPYMVDSNGKMSTNVNYSLENKNKKSYTITITADASWMNAEDRAFPVVIDPGIETEQSSAAIDSVYVASGRASTNLWSDPMIMIGKDSSGIGKCQGLLKFELPGMNRGDVVIDAQLSALQINASAFSPTTPDTALEVHAITSSWVKGSVTWNTKPSFEAETTDFEILKASEAGTALKERNWNVTSIVKRWYENASFPNYGFLLRSSNENASASNDSCIYAWLYGEKYTQSTAGYPVLTITFRSNQGLESYWSYTTLDAGRAGTAQICDFSGNLVFTHEDVSTSGNRAPAGITHVFNNYMATEPFGTVMPYRGHGWMLSCQQQLLPSSKFGLLASAQQKYPYVYVDGDGTEHYFLKKDDGTMIDEDGMGLTLTIPKTSNDFYYKVADDKGNYTYFNMTGGFAKTVDANNNLIANYYTSTQVNEVKKVRDGAGREILIEPTWDNLAVKTVTDPAGRVTTFSWATGKLASITYPDGTSTAFTYDSDAALTSVTAPDGYKLEFTYTSLAGGKKVSKVVEKSPNATGQTITFDYSQPGTTVMRSSGKDGIYGNSDDVYTTIRFDSAGRTVSSEATSAGKSLGAASTEYTASSANSTASNIKQLNRVSRSMAGGQFVRNYLREGSADRGGCWTNLQWAGTATFDGWVSSAEQLYGRWSYYINSKSMNNGAGARAYQSLTSGKFKPGTTYTYSAWVKTKNVVPKSSSNYGAELMATYWRPDGTTQDFHSASVIGTTDTAIHNGWQRISVTFEVPANATKVNVSIMLRDCIGEAYFDGIQLEEGTVANQFNHINNSSFEDYAQQSDGAYLPSDWSGYLTDSHDSVDNAHYKDATHAFRFASVPTVPKEMGQDIYLGGKTAENLDDTYIVSGWVYADPVGGSNENNKISLCAKVIYSDDTSSLNWYDFNSSVKGWQYIMGAFTLRDQANQSAAKTPVRIRIHLIDYRQSNMAWFDNIELVRDEAPSYTYDSKGNLVTVTSNAEQNAKMEYSNDNLTKSVDAKGYQYTYQYDTKHNMTQATSQTGTRYCYQYDANGNPTSLTIKGTGDDSIMTGAHYTANGAFADVVTDQDGISESYNYNDAKGTLTSYTDKNGKVTDYTYNANTDALTSISKALADGRTVQNSYTYSNDKLSTIQHNGTTYQFVYDSFGNVTQTKVGNITLCTNTYGVNNGDLNKVTYGNGAYADYTYDDYGNMVSLAQNGQERFKWSYDSTGNLSVHDDLVNNQRFQYTYDSTGRLVRQSTSVQSTGANMYSAEYGYDLNNNVTRFSSRAGGVSLTESFTYGKDNLPGTYTLPTGKQVSYTYNAFNQRTGASLNTTTPVEIEYQYTPSQRNGEGQDQYTTNKVKEETIGDTGYKYVYDATGNITFVSRNNPGSAVFEPIQQFAYDALNQLIRADDLAKDRTEVYTYDIGGNIVSVTTYPLTWGSLETVTATGTVNYTYGDANWKDKLTAYNGQTITYDTIGNPLSYRGYTLGWQNGRELASLSGNGTTATYTYDTDGVRTSKTVNGVKHEYYYIGDELKYEQFGNTELWFSYDADGTLSGIRYKNGNTVTNYYIACNWRGDVTSIYDSTGALVANYEYDAWGKVTSVKDADYHVITNASHIGNVNSIRYRGYYYDSETGYYYIHSRYYDPEVCRFINADYDMLSATSVAELTDKNYFAYCDNNPGSRADDGGDYWYVIAGAAVVGGVLNSLDSTSALVDAYKGGNSDEIKRSWLKLGVTFTSGAVSGGLAAAGVIASVGASATLDGALAGVESIFRDVIDGNKINWIAAITNAGDSAATSYIFGKVYNKTTEKSLTQYKKQIKKGQNKISKGNASTKSYAKVKGTISTGKVMVKSGKQAIVKINAIGSIAGSAFNLIDTRKPGYILGRQRW